jgi:hypothetical protein
VFASPKEALMYLLQSKEKEINLTMKSSGLIELRNGIKYFQVEVTSKNGTQYGISAYDKEAIELYELTRAYERMPIPSLA